MAPWMHYVQLQLVMSHDMLVSSIQGRACGALHVIAVGAYPMVLHRYHPHVDTLQHRYLVAACTAIAVSAQVRASMSTLAQVSVILSAKSTDRVKQCNTLWPTCRVPPRCKDVSRACHHCSQKFCMRCQVPWHESLSCAAFRALPAEERSSSADIQVNPFTRIIYRALSVCLYGSGHLVVHYTVQIAHCLP